MYAKDIIVFDVHARKEAYLHTIDVKAICLKNTKMQNLPLACFYYVLQCLRCFMLYYI